MPVNAARSKLHVEGKDDLNVIANLVSKYGIDYAVHSAAPVIRDIGSVEELLNGIETAVRLSSDRVIGFVLDADTQQPSRWQSVRPAISLGRAGYPGTTPSGRLHRRIDPLQVNGWGLDHARRYARRKPGVLSANVDWRER